jgi:hypothetical protein
MAWRPIFQADGSGGRSAGSGLVWTRSFVAAKRLVLIGMLLRLDPPAFR